MLTDAQIQEFIRDGYVRIEGAFSPRLAAECRAILWRDTGVDERDPRTWTKPVIRLGMYGQEPFVQAANTPVLQASFDQLVGQGRWLPRTNIGTFPIRFPHPNDPQDAGWHIDTSFPPEDAPYSTEYFDWRVNVYSKGRALLLLFLFSDVGPNEAPTRLRIGSHFDVAKMLAPAGERGRSLRDLAANGFSETSGRPEVHATGDAGTVYLCHPFLVHAAQTHRGTRPRFLAQPALVPSQPFLLNRADGRYCPVEQAIRTGLAGN